MASVSSGLPTLMPKRETKPRSMLMRRPILMVHSGQAAASCATRAASAGVIHIGDAAAAQMLLHTAALGRTVVNNPTVLIAQLFGKPVFHVRNHLGIAAQGFYQVADIGGVVGFIGICHPVIGVYLLHGCLQRLIVLNKALGIKYIKGVLRSPAGCDIPIFPRLLTPFCPYSCDKHSNGGDPSGHRSRW